MTIQEPAQVMSCCNLLVPVCQLSSNSQSARMSFPQVQWVFIVKHYLASRSYLTCHNEFRDIFPDSPVPNKLTSCLVNHFRDTGSMQDRNHSSWPSVLMRASLNMVDIFNTWYNIDFLFSDFNVIYFLTNRTCVRNGLRDFLITLYIKFSLTWRHFPAITAATTHVLIFRGLDLTGSILIAVSQVWPLKLGLFRSLPFGIICSTEKQSFKWYARRGN
jgi:hypothetical protein